MKPYSPAEIAIVKDLMSKHNLTAKDLFSFCICAVNFLEYYYEESMYDMMRSCPERYAYADSNNTKAVAGALNGEKKEEKWTDEDQFFHYMESIQEAVEAEVRNGRKMRHFLEEYKRFEKVYRREIMVPVMLGCPVEDYDDSKFGDEDYIESIVNVDNLTLYKAHEEREKAELEEFRKKEAERMNKEIEAHKDDKDFAVLLVSCTDIARLNTAFTAHNKKYYPDRDYKVYVLTNHNMLIIETGGKSIEEVKETVLKIVKSKIVILGHDMKEELRPVEDVFEKVPQVLLDKKVTHVVTYV